MGEFELYLGIGIEHILDKFAYDHILFVVVLCTMYQLRDWKQILILVTAFTIGHSITLALSTLQIIQVDSDLIELLIPVTILATAFFNIISKSDSIHRSKIQTNYFLALFFGLIHGMGFSNYLRAILGKDESIVTQLFAFNIGLELGQIIIVAVYLAAAFIFVDILRIKRRDWRLGISSAIAGMSFMLLTQALS